MSKFLGDLFKPDGGVEEILLKDVRDWTEFEMNEVQRSDAWWKPNHPLRDLAKTKVADWFQRHFGDGPARVDATGRALDNGFKIPPPHRPTPAQDADGFDLNASIGRIGERTAELGLRSGLTNAVRVLQGAINLTRGLTLASSRNERATWPDPLKVDGVFGPKTRNALKRTATAAGFTKLDEAFGLTLSGFGSETGLFR